MNISASSSLSQQAAQQRDSVLTAFLACMKQRVGLLHASDLPHPFEASQTQQSTVLNTASGMSLPEVLHALASALVDAMQHTIPDTACHEQLSLCADILALHSLSAQQVLGLVLDLRPFLHATEHRGYINNKPYATAYAQPDFTPDANLDATPDLSPDLKLDALHLYFAAAYLDSRDRLYQQRLAALHREHEVLHRWMARSAPSGPASAPSGPACAHALADNACANHSCDDNAEQLPGKYISGAQA